MLFRCSVSPCRPSSSYRRNSSSITSASTAASASPIASTPSWVCWRGGAGGGGGGRAGGAALPDAVPVGLVLREDIERAPWGLVLFGHGSSCILRFWPSILEGHKSCKAAGGFSRGA